MSKTRLYEELSLNAHPSLQTQLYDGWILRYANGYTNRANSICPLYPSEIDPLTKIAECEKRYFERGMSTTFKLTDDSDPGLDSALAGRGYTIVTPTFVMDMDIHDKAFSSGESVITNHADNDFLEAYFAISRYTDNTRIDAAKKIFENVRSPMICARIVKNGATVACGSSVVERDHAMLHNIVVDETKRGMGYGQEVCEALLFEAKRAGALVSYLQVIQDNHVAINLYKKLGFKTAYSYWYRARQYKA